MIDYPKFSLPKDYTAFPEFRQLQGRLGFMTANHVFTLLWRELAYQATSIPANPPPLGCISVEEFSLFGIESRIPDFAPHKLAEPLIEAGVLKKDGQWYFCPTFALFNEELSRDCRCIHDMAAFKRMRDNIEQKIVGNELAKLPPELFALVDGKLISPAEMNRIIVLIRLLDSIYRRAPRAQGDYELGLLYDACRFIRRFDPEKVDLILNRLLARRRTIPFRTPERFLSCLDRSLEYLWPEEGWHHWSKTAHLGKKRTLMDS